MEYGKKNYKKTWNSVIYIPHAIIYIKKIWYILPSPSNNKLFSLFLDITSFLYLYFDVLKNITTYIMYSDIA